MKTRSGFVSNSSSSSFCIMGLPVDDETCDKLDALRYKELEKKGLCTHCGLDNYYEQKIAGASVTEMREDETLAQFKQRVVNGFKSLNIDVKVDDLAWRIDGGMDS